MRIELLINSFTNALDKNIRLKKRSDRRFKVTSHIVSTSMQGQTF